ncbi:hypothetical protein JCM10213_008122 [Rhodosporidiobolus nylandii]
MLLELCLASASLSVLSVLAVGLVGSCCAYRHSRAVLVCNNTHCVISHPLTYDEALAEAARLYPDLDTSRLALETVLPPHTRIRLSEQSWNPSMRLAREGESAREVPVYYVVETDEDDAEGRRTELSGARTRDVLPP